MENIRLYYIIGKFPSISDAREWLLTDYLKKYRIALSQSLKNDDIFEMVSMVNAILLRWNLDDVAELFWAEYLMKLF